MSPAAKGRPNPALPPGPDGMYDIRLLAERLGLTAGTLRGYVHMKPRPGWLPEPEKRYGRLVWPAEALAEAQIDDPRPSPGRPAKK